MKIQVILIWVMMGLQYLLPAQKTIMSSKQLIKDNTTYYLTSIYIGKQKNNLVRDKGHIVFDTKKKTAVCFTSCNFIRMKYTIKDQTIKFTSIVPDKDPCPDGLIGIEADIKENLPKIDSYSISGKQLTFSGNKEPLIVFTEAETRAPVLPKK